MTEEKKPSSSGLHRIAFDEHGEPVTPEAEVHAARNAQLKADLRLGTLARALRLCVETIHGALDDKESRISDESAVRLREALMRSEGILDRYVTADDKPKEP